MCKVSSPRGHLRDTKKGHGEGPGMARAGGAENPQEGREALAQEQMLICSIEQIFCLLKIIKLSERRQTRKEYILYDSVHQKC